MIDYLVSVVSIPLLYLIFILLICVNDILQSVVECRLICLLFFHIPANFQCLYFQITFLQ